MTLSIVFREKGLIPLLRCLKPRVASLPVGDTTCNYEGNSAWAMGRKSADDLTA